MGIMKFSIIIPTRNRPEKLQKLLCAIGEQTYDGDFETIVNDQSEHKSPPAAPAKGAFLYLQDDGRGAARARNRAIDKARGDYLVWLDDNAVVESSYLASIDRLVDRHPDHSCLCGAVLNIEDRLPFSRYLLARMAAVNFINLDCCLASAMVMKKQTFLESGLLDESLGTGKYFGGSEETDLVLRLLEKGDKVLYSPEFSSLHPRTDPFEMDLNAWLSKNYHYGLGRGAMLRKHFKIKPFWALAYFAYSVFAPLGGCIGSLALFRGRQAGRYLVSVAGRITGFIIYRGANGK